MRKLILVLIIGSLVGVARAEDHTGDLGLGVVLGDVSGPSMKYFIGPNTAFDVGVGFSHDMEAFGDIVWHGWNVFPKPQQGRFSGYLGFGPRFEERDHADDQFGVRGIGGIDYWMDPYPIEFFLEAGPWFIFTPDTDTEFDLGIGLRYFFRPGANGGGRSSRR